MKGKGKWAVLLLVLGFVFAGCLGSSGSSSDEGAIAAKDNPVMGTWQVSVDPQNAKVDIVPITLGATSLEPTYSWTNQVIVTDLVVRGAETVNTIAMSNTIDLPHTNIVPGSERVTNSGHAAPCIKGVDYNISYLNMTSVLNPGPPPYYTWTKGPSQLGRVNGSTCILLSDTVTVHYGYGVSGDAAWNAGTNTLTLSMSVENHLNATIEKLRTWTGTVAGTGAPANPTIAVNYADYPLLQPQNDANYARPSITAQPIEGWTAGICYSTWGKWDDPLTPRIEGCKLVTRGVVQYNPGWVDPVCARVTETVAYTGTASPFAFYMQLTGDVNAWSPDYVAFPGGADTRFNKTEYSTWYALMAYLVPDAAGIQYPASPAWCSGVLNNATQQIGWRTGSIIPIKPGDTRHCGTLITDPHLPPRTYFAANFGIEYSDTVEKQAKTFWDIYITNPLPNVKQAVGAPYMSLAAVGVLYDISTLQTFTGNTNRTGHGGNTWFPGGFSDNSAQYVAANAALGFKNHIRYEYKAVDPATGIIIATQMIDTTSTANSNFSFFTTATVTSTAPYITAAATCPVVAGLPRWAGQWGVAHYDSSCNLITEGADADLDYFVGMLVFKVRNTAKAGDYGFIRFDQSSNSSLKYAYNNWDANNKPSGPGVSEDLTDSYCVRKGGIMDTCPGASSTTWSIYTGIEYPNELLPPGQAQGQSAYFTGCPLGAWTCGGHQYVTAVVCVK